MPGDRPRDCVVIHPGVQHSALLAAALERSGRLLHLVTGLQIGADPTLFWSAVLRSKRARRILQRRVFDYLPDHRIERRGQVRQIIGRGSARRQLGAEAYNRNLRVAEAFARRAVERLDDQVRHVFLTEGVALGGLRAASEAKRPLVKVLDVAHPFVRTATRLMRQDAAHLGLPLPSYDDVLMDSPELLARESAELHLADVVLVASTFTRDSIVAEGIDPSRIKVVPYGLPELPEAAAVGTDRADVLKLVFVGALSERKGVTLLLRAMRQLEARRIPVELDLIGSLVPGFSLDTAGGLGATVIHRSGLSGAEVRRSIKAAHYLVLPSMCEGFGRVLIEALALGTGVITTERSAGPDLLARHPEAPIVVIPAEERDRLADVLAERRDQVAAEGVDREAAAAAGRSYDLDSYGQAVSQVLDDLAGSSTSADP